MGVRAYAETHPQSPGTGDDSQQLLELAKYASVALVVLMMLIVVGLDIGVAQTAKAIR